MAGCDLERVSALPAELKKMIFSYLSPDLQTLCQTGHILITDDRAVSLPCGMRVRTFLVGGGGGADFDIDAHEVKLYSLLNCTGVQSTNGLKNMHHSLFSIDYFSHELFT